MNDQLTKRHFQIGDIAYRRNEDNEIQPEAWVQFTVNQTYLKLIEEFPEDYMTAEEYFNRPFK